MKGVHKCLIIHFFTNSYAEDFKMFQEKQKKEKKI